MCDSRPHTMMLRKSIPLDFSCSSTIHSSDGMQEAHGWSNVCVAHAADESQNVVANRAHHEEMSHEPRGASFTVSRLAWNCGLHATRLVTAVSGQTFHVCTSAGCPNVPADVALFASGVQVHVDWRASVGNRQRRVHKFPAPGASECDPAFSAIGHST